jgi:hypothetical protein
MDSNASTQPVTLSTQTQYLIPSQNFMIPTSWRRYQLSQLINKVLELPKPVPFDFLVKGELLRTTLAAWCAENGVGEVCDLYLTASIARSHLFDPGRNSRTRVRRIGYASSKNVGYPSRRLGVGCLVSTKRVRSFHFFLSLLISAAVSFSQRPTMGAFRCLITQRPCARVQQLTPP